MAWGWAPGLPVRVNSSRLARISKRWSQEPDLGDVSGAGVAEAGGEGGVGQEAGDAGDEGRAVAEGDEEAVFVVFDDLDHATGGGGDDGFLVGPGFEEDDAEGVGAGGHGEDVDGVVEVGDAGLGEGAQEV